MFSRKVFLIFLLASLLVAACSATPSIDPSGKLKAVASTTIVGDVARQVGGDLIDLTVLFPTGADPHTFEPRPQDIAAISKAGVILLNGLGLEEALEPALDASVEGAIVHVSDGIELLEFGTGMQDEDHEGDEHTQDTHGHGDHDPHTWTDPNNVIIWTQNIASAFAQADPSNADNYRANAEAYIAELRELDSWIRDQVETIPSGRRELVTDHAVLGYFANAYGFEQVGLVVAGLSTNAAPSAKELAELVDAIEAHDVPAIFVGKSVNASLAEQIAKDTGVQVVSIYTGSLSEPGSEADSYLKFMRYNVNAIVEALK